MFHTEEGHDDRGVAVAVGESVVPRAHWESTELHDGDVVEIVSATPGG